MRNDLFEAPTKIVNGDNSVENVLGRFEHADRMLNCIGVDYAPPTPAPSNHHIIGKELCMYKLLVCLYLGSFDRVSVQVKKN